MVQAPGDGRDSRRADGPGSDTSRGKRGWEKGILLPQSMALNLGVQQDVRGYNPVEMGFWLTRRSTAQIFTSP